MAGWIKVDRGIINHWIWSDPEKLKWWLDILFAANHADKKVNVGMSLIECKRGQSLRSLDGWAKRWGVSKSRVNRFFLLLKNDSMIETESVQRTTRLTVCNYDSYQDVRNDSETIKEHQRNDSETIPSHKQEYKEIEEYKEIKDKSEFSGENRDAQHLSRQSINFEKLVEKFNIITAGKFGSIRMPLSETRRKMIKARVSEHGKQTFIDVIKRATKSDFLSGQNSRSFTATFDWIIKPTNFEKILSGNYDNNPNSNINERNGKSAPNSPIGSAAGENYKTEL